MMKQGTATRRATVGLLLATALGVLSACDGENLFRTDNPPEITQFLVSSDAVVEQDSIQFGIEATGPRSIQSFRLEFTGAFVWDTTYTLKPGERGTTVARVVSVLVPPATETAELLVTATAVDVSPDTSDAETAEVRIIDATPPLVYADRTDPPEVGAPLRVVVAAADARGVAEVGIQVTDSVFFDTTLVQPIAPARDTGGMTESEVQTAEKALLDARYAFDTAKLSLD